MKIRISLLILFTIVFSISGFAQQQLSSEFFSDTVTKKFNRIHKFLDYQGDFVVGGEFFGKEGLGIGISRIDKNGNVNWVSDSVKGFPKISGKIEHLFISGDYLYTTFSSQYDNINNGIIKSNLEDGSVSWVADIDNTQWIKSFYDYDSLIIVQGFFTKGFNKTIQLSKATGDIENLSNIKGEMLVGEGEKVFSIDFSSYPDSLFAYTNITGDSIVWKKDLYKDYGIVDSSNLRFLIDEKGNLIIITSNIIISINPNNGSVNWYNDFILETIHNIHVHLTKDYLYLLKRVPKSSINDETVPFFLIVKFDINSGVDLWNSKYYYRDMHGKYANIYLYEDANKDFYISYNSVVNNSNLYPNLIKLNGIDGRIIYEKNLGWGGSPDNDFSVGKGFLDMDSTVYYLANLKYDTVYNDSVSRFNGNISILDLGTGTKGSTIELTGNYQYESYVAGLKSINEDSIIIVKQIGQQFRLELRTKYNEIVWSKTIDDYYYTRAKRLLTVDDKIVILCDISNLPEPVLPYNNRYNTALFVYNLSGNRVFKTSLNSRPGKIVEAKVFYANNFFHLFYRDGKDQFNHFVIDQNGQVVNYEVLPYNAAMIEVYSQNSFLTAKISGFFRPAYLYLYNKENYQTSLFKTLDDSFLLIKNITLVDNNEYLITGIETDHPNLGSLIRYNTENDQVYYETEFPEINHKEFYSYNLSKDSLSILYSYSIRSQEFIRKIDTQTGELLWEFNYDDAGSVVDSIQDISINPVNNSVAMVGYSRNEINRYTFVNILNSQGETIDHFTLSDINSQRNGGYEIEYVGGDHLFIGGSQQNNLGKAGYLLFNSKRTSQESRGEIKGYTFIDSDKNGVFNTGDKPLSNVKINLTPSESTTISGKDGSFSFSMPQGAYVLSYDKIENWELTSDSINYNINLKGGESFENLNFGFEPIAPSQNLSIVINSGAIVCDNYVDFKITFLNSGTSNVSGTAWFTLDPSIEQFSSYDLADYYKENQIGWDFIDLTPGESFVRKILVRVPNVSESIPTGSILSFTGYFTPVGNIDTKLFNFIYSPIVKCTVNTFEKLVSPFRDSINNYTEYTEELTYTIRFQNNENIEIRNVIIIDTLDVKLDMKTFRVISTSHPDNLKVSFEKNIARFEFPDINFSSSSNELTNHGYISYSISLKHADSISNDFTQDQNNIYFIVNNRASILFDENSPKHTNKTINTIVKTLPTITSVDQVFVDTAIGIFPNPFRGNFTLEIKAGSRMRDIKISIFDSVGRLLIQEHKPAFNRTDFVKEMNIETRGIYLVLIKIDGQMHRELIISQ